MMQREPAIHRTGQAALMQRSSGGVTMEDRVIRESDVIKVLAEWCRNAMAAGILKNIFEDVPVEECVKERLTLVDTAPEKVVAQIRFDPDEIADRVIEGIRESNALGLDAHPETQGWIRCSDRLPEPGNDYIVMLEDETVKVLSYSGKVTWQSAPDAAFTCFPIFYIEDDDYGYIHYDDVIAWMPIPELK